MPSPGLGSKREEDSEGNTHASVSALLSFFSRAPIDADIQQSQEYKGMHEDRGSQRRGSIVCVTSPAGFHKIPRACMLSHFSRVQLFATLWSVAHQTPLSMGFSRQKYWSGLPCPPCKIPYTVLLLERITGKFITLKNM